jgi:hypothetical protein
MVSGRACIKGTLKDFLVAGLSSHQLWFRREGSPEEEKVLSSWSEGEREGHQCTSCGAVLLRSRPETTQADGMREEKLCSNCLRMIAGDSIICEFCRADVTQA